jgi:hypothetical protein
MIKINLKKYFAPKNKKVLILNIFIVFAYILLICGLIYYVNGVLYKYLFDPYIGISESHRQVHEIPFPAVTFCSPVVLRSDLVNLKQIHRFYTPKDTTNLTVSEQNFLFAKAQMCFRGDTSFFNKASINKSENNVVKLLKQGAPNVPETFAICGVNNRILPCFFTRSITDVGLCYTFNMQSHDVIFNDDVTSSDFDVFKGKKVSNFSKFKKHNGF